MANGEELHELHVDQRGTGGKREGVALARHAGARVEPGQPAGRDHGRPRRHRDGAAGLDIEARGAREPPVRQHGVGHDEAGDAPDRVHAVDAAAQRCCDGGACVEDVHVAAAPALVAGGGHLGDMPVLPRPADLPRVHLADTRRSLLAEQRCECRIAQLSACLQRVLQVLVHAVRLGLAEGGGDGHLRHHRGPTPPHHVAIGEHDPLRARPPPRRAPHTCRPRPPRSRARRRSPGRAPRSSLPTAPLGLPAPADQSGGRRWSQGRARS